MPDENLAWEVASLRDEVKVLREALEETCS